MTTLQSIADALSAKPGERLAIHRFETVTIGGPRAGVHAEIITFENVAAYDGDVCGVTITLLRPISDANLPAERAKFDAWLVASIASAAEERGDGLLLGCDPLWYEARLGAKEFGHTDQSFFVWDRRPGAPSLFDWCDVAAVSTDPDVAMVFLVDGRVVVLHADVDWRNRLS